MIGVMSGQLSVAATLERLKKNKFARPNFKVYTGLPLGAEETVKIMATEFEKNRGQRLGQSIQKIKQDSKAWSRVAESVLILSNGTGKESFPADFSMAQDEARGSNSGAADKAAKKKVIPKDDLERMKAQAKEAEITLNKRHQAAIQIQAIARRNQAIMRAARMRLERKAAIMIQHFLKRLVQRRNRAAAVLETFRNHFYASVLQRFLRECAEKNKRERRIMKKDQLLRAFFNGVKARMVFSLPRLRETRQTITEISEKLDHGDLPADEYDQLEDDLKYQKNLYLNLFYKFWNKKASVQEELHREAEKLKKRKALQSSSPRATQERQFGRRSPSIKEHTRSKLSSRKPSTEVTYDDLRSSFQGTSTTNPDDRPIKPMRASFGSGFAGTEMEQGRLPSNTKARPNREPKTSGPKKEISDKVIKQRELMDKRRKYDPRKVLQSSQKEEEESKLRKSLDKNKRDDPHKSLDHIAENPSEDKSGYLMIDELGVIDHGDPNRPKKDFLKRKSKKVEFKKLDWTNVQSRIDCWVPKENIPDKKELARQRIGKLSPRGLGSLGMAHPSKDLNMIKLKADEGKRKDLSKKNKEEKKDKDILQQIEETLIGSYLPKLDEVLTKEIVVNPGSMIPVLKNDSRFILYIEENELKDVLEELEEEYEFLVNL